MQRRRHIKTFKSYFSYLWLLKEINLIFDFSSPLKRMYELTEKLVLHIHSWQVNAKMQNSLLRDFYLVSLVFIAL